MKYNTYSVFVSIRNVRGVVRVWQGYEEAQGVSFAVIITIMFTSALVESCAFPMKYQEMSFFLSRN